MPDLRRPRIAVSAMFFLNGGLFGIWASRIPAFVERFSMSEGVLGLLLLCLGGGAIISFPLAGMGSDRIGAARLTRFLAVGYGIALVLLALAPSLPLLAVALLLFGVGHGGMDVAMNAWAAEVERHLARPVMSSFHAMFSLGAGAGAASGFLALGAGVGVTAHFAVTGLIVLAITLALASRPWASVLSPGPGTVFAIPRGPLVAVGAVAAAASIGEGAAADWSAVYLDTVVGATSAQAALGYAAFSVAMVAVRLAGGPIVSHFGAPAAARISGGAAFAGVALVVLASGLVPALAGFALMGVGYAVIMPLAFSRAADQPGIGAGRAIASVATFGYGGMLLGPPLIGALAGFVTLRGAFVLLAVLALAIVALASVLERD